MANTRDLATQPKIKLLVWGPSGSGKTTLVGTARELGPIYIFDFDHRLEGLSHLDIEYDKYADLNPKQPQAMDKAYSQLEKFEKMSADSFPYTTVVVDSLTTLAVCAMNRGIVMADAWGKIKRMSDTRVNVAAMQDYQAMMSYVEQFTIKLVALPCHVIMTAHEDTEKDETLGRVFKAIAISGKLSGKLPGYFNEFWRMVVDTIANSKGVLEPRFTVITRPDTMYSARTCYPNALEVKEKPDFAAMYRKICASLKPPEVKP